MSPSGINYTLLSSQMRAGDSLLGFEARRENLPTLQTAFNAHLTLRAIGQGSSAQCERYTRVLHDDYGLSWEEIGLQVVDKRVYDLALQIVDTHLSKATDAVSRENILYCIPIQRFTDGQYESIVPAFRHMSSFPGQRTRLYEHAVSLIHCEAHRSNKPEVTRLLETSGLVNANHTHCPGFAQLVRVE